MSPQSSDNSEKLLAAHRYLSGDLSPAEVNLFEEQLQNDTECCEALVEMVLLHQALAVGQDQETTLLQKLRRQDSQRLSSRRQLRTIGVVGLTLVALILVAVFTFNGSEHDQHPTNLKTANQGTNRQLINSDDLAAAALWSSIDGHAVVEEDESLSPLAEEAIGVENSDSSYEVPDWMFAAVQAGISSEMDKMDSLDDELYEAEETL